MGRPKTKISPSEMKKAESYALAGCQNNTIATLMEWDEKLIGDRADIRKLLTKKRAQRKLRLLNLQNKTAAGKGKSAGSMQIFLGKNELDQSDRQELKLQGGETPLIVVIGGKFSGAASPDNPS